jgi:hypothetical protein
VGSSVAIRKEEYFSDPCAIKNEPSKGKMLDFVIVIILGLGILAAAGLELGGYLQTGSLSNLSQVNSIMIMAVCGGAGIVFLIIGVVGAIKNRQGSSHLLSKDSRF